MFNMGDLWDVKPELKDYHRQYDDVTFDEDVSVPFTGQKQVWSAEYVNIQRDLSMISGNTPIFYK